MAHALRLSSIVVSSLYLNQSESLTSVLLRFKSYPLLLHQTEIYISSSVLFEQCFLCVIITYLSMISEKKYPDPVLEEPILAFDPLSAALTMISCSEDSSQGLSERSQYRAIAESHDEIKYGAISVVLDIKNITAVTMAAIDRRAHKGNFPYFAHLDFGFDYGMPRLGTNGLYQAHTSQNQALSHGLMWSYDNIESFANMDKFELDYRGLHLRFVLIFEVEVLQQDFRYFVS
ncbi:hypothetical protein HID58_028642 [Brassica napus]|uniref:Uncharacterized protein n=1 Tax=Brassica napus TaxID=3708 RepID=A0ABQ8CCU5_BRANA|nr:hypothetical protein HID58_028642 [Brassica napus]